MYPSLTIKTLMNKRIHFGHKKNYWNQDMIPYLYGIRHKLHIFDLEKTICSLRNTCRFIKSMTSSGGKILFVCSDERFFHLVEKISHTTGQPYIVGRWIGGLLTNILSLQKARLNRIRSSYKYKSLHDLRVQRGIEQLDQMPSALFLIGESKSAILEAYSLSIPIIKICDSNSSTFNVSYVIPGNGDSLESISFYLDLVKNSIHHERKSN